MRKGTYFTSLLVLLVIFPANGQHSTQRHQEILSHEYDLSELVSEEEITNILRSNGRLNTLTDQNVYANLDNSQIESLLQRLHYFDQPLTEGQNQHEELAPLYAAADENNKVTARYLVALRRPMAKVQVDDLLRRVNRYSGAAIRGTPVEEEGQNMITMFEATGNKRAIDFIRRNPNTRYTEEVQIYQADKCACVPQPNVGSWGVSRMDQRNREVGNSTTMRATHAYVGDTSSVDVYVLDTGVYTGHSEFGGRASWGTNAADQTNTDTNGHGTHVAGTIAGRSYGVARNAKIWAVKVLGSGGGGSTTTVIKGLNFVKKHHFWRRFLLRKAVVKLSLQALTHVNNMLCSLSLGGPKSKAMNEAVRGLFFAGIPVVVAAGNNPSSACDSSPPSEPSVITVGCSDQNDRFCSFSARGSCVNILAPGVAIKSAWAGNPFASRTISGTSMSAPHVTGALANYLGCNPLATPWGARSWVMRRATQGVIQNVPPGTKNKLVYDACEPKLQDNLNIFNYATAFVTDSFSFVKNIVRLMVPASIL